MNILFVGENWNGSSARSLHQSLDRRPDVTVGEVAEDHFLPRHQSLPLRIANRILKPWQRAELANEIRRKLDALEPDIVLVYKGNGVSASLVSEVTSGGTMTVNVYPDCSPSAHGSQLAEALGEYDLVVSTKPFHPEAWGPVYGYSNKCVFVPHGYDESVHYWPDPPQSHDYDVVLAASWRLEYQDLMADLAEALGNDSISVAVTGPGWRERWRDRPEAWDVSDGRFGRAYGRFVRRGRIAIAPVHRRVVINGRQQPGDEDTTRTYELAAAHTFFLHQRTEYVQTVYDEETEVPMWSSPQELADLIRHFLDRPDERRAMARAAHSRSVPDYSVVERAGQVLEYIQAELDARAS